MLAGLSYDTQLYVFRIGIWVVPLPCSSSSAGVCRELQSAERIEEEHQHAEEEAKEHERGMSRAPTQRAR